MLKTLTEISYLRQKGLLSENKESDETVIKKTLLDVGTVIDGAFTFGTGITAFLPGVRNLLEGEMPYLSEQSILLLYITAMWIILSRHTDKVPKLMAMLKEEGLGETLNKVVSFLKSLEDVGLKIAKEVGYAASNIADVGAFTFLAFPILDATLYLIGNDNITLDNPSAYLKSILISIGILSVKNIFNSVIKNIKNKFGTLEETHFLPNDEGISGDVFHIIRKTLLESSSQTWFLPEELDVTRTYMIGEKKYEVEVEIGREVIKEKYILEIKTGNNNNILINLQINPLHEPRIYEHIYKVLVECISRFNYESQYPVLLREEPESSPKFKPFLDNENLKVTIPLTKEALCSIPGHKWCDGWIESSKRLSSGTVYIIEDKRTNQIYLYHHHGKVPMLLDSQSFTLYDKEAHDVNHRKFMSELPGARKAFGLEYTAMERIKYDMGLSGGEFAEYSSFNSFSKAVAGIIKNGGSITDFEVIIESFLGDDIKIALEGQRSTNRYGLANNKVEVEDWGITLYIPTDVYEEHFLGLNDDDNYYYTQAMSYPHGDHYEEMDTDELNYMACWFDVNVLQRVANLTHRLGKGKEGVRECSDWDDGEMSEFFEMYFPSDWDNTSRDMLDTIGYGVGEHRAKELKEYIVDDTLFEFEDHGQFYTQPITWIQLLYLIHKFQLTTLSDLWDEESNKLEENLSESWYDNYDWSDGTTEEVNRIMGELLDKAEKVDRSEWLDNEERWKAIIKELENVPGVEIIRSGNRTNHDAWNPLWKITISDSSPYGDTINKVDGDNLTRSVNVHSLNFGDGTIEVKGGEEKQWSNKHTIDMEEFIPTWIQNNPTLTKVGEFVEKAPNETSEN